MIRSFGGHTDDGQEWTVYWTDVEPKVGMSVTFVLAGIEHKGIVEWVNEEKSND